MSALGPNRPTPYVEGSLQRYARWHRKPVRKQGDAKCRRHRLGWVEGERFKSVLLIKAQRPVDVIARTNKERYRSGVYRIQKPARPLHCSHSRVAELLNDPRCEPNGRIGSAHRTASVVECHADAQRPLLRLSKRQLCRDILFLECDRWKIVSHWRPLAAGNGVNQCEAESTLRCQMITTGSPYTSPVSQFPGNRPLLSRI